jgi:hypothetical protein
VAARLPGTCLLTLLALASAAFAPSASAQTPLDETCQESSPSATVCTGSEKLGERVGAECRRAGVPDADCAPPSGRRVIGAEVAAHADSWLHRALASQYELGSEVPFRDAPWIGTHNSFNSTSELPTLSHTDSNQQLSLRDQLDIDVRSLELDVHWSPSVHAGGARAPVVCHARPASEAHAGCTTERLLDAVLGDVAGWLNDHSDQVLLLYLEDAIEDPAGYARTRAVIDSTLRGPDGSDLVHRPSGAGCAELPLDMTRRDVLARGAQVVIVASGCGLAPAAYDWDGPHVESGDSSTVGAPPGCDTRFDRATYASKLVRYFEDSTWIATATEPTAPPSDEDRITPEKAARMARCGVDLLGMDQLLPRDGRLEALVWSWAPGAEPGAVGCAAQRADGRWEIRPCGERRRPACRRADGSWVVPRPAVPYAVASARCGAVRAEHDVPRTGYENEQLHAAAGGDELWLKHRR